MLLLASRLPAGEPAQASRVSSCQECDLLDQVERSELLCDTEYNTHAQLAIFPMQNSSIFFHDYEILHVSGALVKVSRGMVSRQQTTRTPSGTHVAQAVTSSCCGCPVFGAQGCCLIHPGFAVQIAPLLLQSSPLHARTRFEPRLGQCLAFVRVNAS